MAGGLPGDRGGFEGNPYGLPVRGLATSQPTATRLLLLGFISPEDTSRRIPSCPKFSWPLSKPVVA